MSPIGSIKMAREIMCPISDGRGPMIFLYDNIQSRNHYKDHHENRIRKTISEVIHPSVHKFQFDLLPMDWARCGCKKLIGMNNCEYTSEKNKKKTDYTRLKPFKAQSEKSDQALRRFARFDRELNDTKKNRELDLTTK